MSSSPFPVAESLPGWTQGSPDWLQRACFQHRTLLEDPSLVPTLSAPCLLGTRSKRPHERAPPSQAARLPRFLPGGCPLWVHGSPRPLTSFCPGSPKRNCPLPHVRLEKRTPPPVSNRDGPHLAHVNRVELGQPEGLPLWSRLQLGQPEWLALWTRVQLHRSQCGGGAIATVGCCFLCGCKALGADVYGLRPLKASARLLDAAIDRKAGLRI